MSQHMDLTRVIVGGFGYSGSSAIVDWMQEKPGCVVFPAEWDFFRQPDGLQDLRDALTQRVSNRRAHVALKRFMYLAATMARPPGAVFGRGFEALAYPGLEQDLLTFAESLVALSIPSPVTARFLEDHQRYQPAPRGPAPMRAVKASLMRKIRRRAPGPSRSVIAAVLRLLDADMAALATDPLAPKAILAPEPMTPEVFDARSRPHFDAITAKMAGPTAGHLVLDQGFSSAGAKAGLGLMSNTKAIYVHRDPRDVYLSSVTRNLDWIPIGSVEDFATWFRITMPKADLDDPRIRVIAFEDLVHRPDAVLDHLAAFLGLDPQPGPLHRTRFDPAVSVKNSGKWRDHPDQALMQKVWDATQEHYQFMQAQSVTFGD